MKNGQNKKTKHEGKGREMCQTSKTAEEERSEERTVTVGWIR